jgi:quinolinate synthase
MENYTENHVGNRMGNHKAKNIGNEGRSNMDREMMIQEIQRLKKERDAVIVAHSYQIGEVQDVADVVGDSFALARFCASSPARTIVFCGVHFMAESAKILSPEKTVLLPEIHAGCPMADMVTGEELRKRKAELPGIVVVCYINTSAEVKAECDVCCTSSNAVDVIRSIPEKDILFVPDQNLGSWVAKQVPEKNIILWDGYCITHHRVRKDDVLKMRKLHPDAVFLVHPECRAEILELADFIGSTKQIIDYARNSPAEKFIIGTEMGVLHQLQHDSPTKKFYLMSPGLVCPNMKKTTLASVYESLRDGKYDITVDEDIRVKAKVCLDRMLHVAK